MEIYLEYALLVFTSLFAMMNPIGVIPVYMSMTSKLPSEEAKRVAFKSSLTACLTLFFFAFSGKFIFDFFAISVNSLKVVGGIIFFITGYDMLQARFVRTKSENETEVEFANDVAITPLAIPIICGPGAITVVIIYMQEGLTIVHNSILLFCVFGICSLTWITLLSSRKIFQFLGANGNKVMMRIMGLIVMVIAVEFFFSGLKPIIQGIIH
ncbi:MAG: MarC family protein [Calditrichaeota bacterium]|nr:MAG: MarC family protein [Calditrichota bacterium]